VSVTTRNGLWVIIIFRTGVKMYSLQQPFIYFIYFSHVTAVKLLTSILVVIIIL